MRTEAEIQEAHDLLCGIKLGEVKIDLPASAMVGLTVALDALCWVLWHDHNVTFQENLDGLREAAKELGYELREGEG